MRTNILHTVIATKSNGMVPLDEFKDLLNSRVTNLFGRGTCRYRRYGEYIESTEAEVIEVIDGPKLPTDKMLDDMEGELIMRYFVRKST